MPYKDPNKQREYQRKWTKNNRISQKKYMRRIRKEVIEMLGGKCINCGCNDYDALEINHINGGGNEEIRQIGKKSFIFAIHNGTRKTNDLEVTCRVCNALHYLIDIKGLQNKWKITYK